jgi:fatty acid desaturase
LAKGNPTIGLKDFLRGEWTVNATLEKMQYEQIDLFKIKSKSSDVTFSLKLIVYFGLIILGGIMVFSPLLILQALGVFIMGAMFTHGVELQHQVLHSQGYRDRKSNEFIGVILGLPLLVSFAGYRASHLRHHKLLGTPENKEFFDYGDQYGAGKLLALRSLAQRFLMPGLYAQFIKNSVYSLVGRDFDDELPHVSAQMRRDYRAMLAMIILLAALSFFTENLIIVSLWLLPMVLVGVPLHALVEMPEHFGCDTDSRDPFANTRTIKSNAFMTWYTNGNNYHVEHHLMPGLPIDRLHDLHGEIENHIQYYHTTYRDFFGSAFTGKLGKRSDVAKAGA